MFVGSPKQQQQPSEAADAVPDVTHLPAPIDPGIRLSVAGGELLAVMPFEGYITPEAAAAVRAKLAAALQAGASACRVRLCGVGPAACSPDGKRCVTHCSALACPLHVCCWLAADGLALAPEEAEGFFRVAQYGQVYTLLQTRLNEMMLRVLVT
jgi:hypothetical protein